MEKKYDFSGWATKNNIVCSDGVVIRRDAFKHLDGKTVPLVWNHLHNDVKGIIGHALLENRDEGVYAYCSLNDTEYGSHAKELVKHGDVEALSIYANGLRRNGNNVIHGEIREVSLVIAGANQGATIDKVLIHSDGSTEELNDDEGILFTGDSFNLELFHSDNNTVEKKDTKDSEQKGETVEDVFNTLDEKQKTVVYAMIGQALEENEKNGEDDDNKNEGGNETMKHNAFDQDDETPKNEISHSAMMAIVNDAKRYGSLKESFLAHANDYGITNIEYLFPDYKNVTKEPQFIKRDTGWVSKVMSSVHHTPFSRIKSMFADITADEARAKGYLKGNLKKEEVFTLLKRTTSPTTIYKKQKLDRDDVVDITDFDVVAWIKSEMRMMLDEEIARAILISDGRLASSDDKIKEDCVRPIIKDDELFTVHATVDVEANASSDVKAKAFIRKVIKARKDYKGSGNPTLFTTEDWVTDCLLLEDKNGRVIYESVDKLATTLRAKEIVTVPPMEGTKGANGKPLIGILVNLNDYNVGADKGGSVNMFDDFDIDYNAQKYLIETRCSGALTVPFSAIEFTLNETSSAPAV